MSFNQFNFMGQYYCQCSGMPMGSSLSPGLSCLFMEWFETELINDVIPKDKQPLFWLRYIDDVICCFEDLSVLDEFLSALNSIRDSISFTVEVRYVFQGMTTKICLTTLLNAYPS